YPQCRRVSAPNDFSKRAHDFDSFAPNKHSATRMLCERRLHNNIRADGVVPKPAVASGWLIAHASGGSAVSTLPVQLREEHVSASKNPTAIERWGRLVPLGHPDRNVQR
ncbi:hypothetical protein, partial [Yoonia sp.]|uniref:hypothetical protein n=1 Tax=Yoonia sp. TaxID=2212373 RepID=UPI002E03FA91|nr:hypothetical protein [Yoonia sp.]